tara:strand:- start:47 stop:430 length:384 start_codon:yes stop_codon:yes gene_type:complete
MNSNNTYQEYLNEYNKQLQSGKYLFLIKKCCGYGFLFSFHKNATLKDFYKYIYFELQNDKPIKLYINHDDIVSENPIPSNEELLGTFFTNHIKNGVMKPQFTLPSPVVYEIYLDDGHHSSECNRQLN